MLYILYDGDMKIYCITRVIHYIDIKLNQKLIQQQLALKLHGAGYMSARYQEYLVSRKIGERKIIDGLSDL